MSDPLSVAASISGLIALAGELYIALDEFISNVRDAPSLAQTIQSEIKSFRNSLHALHRVLQDPAFCRNKRASLIPADYVFVSFTDAVLVFSQLEANVLPLTRFTDFGVVARMQWTRKKVRLNELVARLQWQKHTLVLQLNILRCESDIEAERDRQVLDTLICGRRGKDRDMERRLELVEQQLNLPLNASIRDRSSIISSSTSTSDNLTIRAGNSNPSDQPLSSIGTYQHAFEDLLNSSWVYRRNQNREEDMSMRSSVLRVSAWSVLSDMSLANISIIAVMSLPVQVQELSNGGWYSATSDHAYGGIEDPVEVSGSSTSANVAVGDEEYDTDEEFSTTWAKGASDQTNTNPLLQHDVAVVDPRSTKDDKDEYRTSLLMPLLAARFSMLRDQDGPIPMLSNAGDEGVEREPRMEVDGPGQDLGEEQAVAPADAMAHDGDASAPKLDQPDSNLQGLVNQFIEQNAAMMQRFRDVETQERKEVPVDKQSRQLDEDVRRKPKARIESRTVAPLDSVPDDQDIPELKFDQQVDLSWRIFVDQAKEKNDRAKEKNAKPKQTSANVGTQEDVEISRDEQFPMPYEFLDMDPYPDLEADSGDEDVYPCKGCGEILEEGKAFELAGNRWHIECFRCNSCSMLLDSDANLLLLGDGSLICNNCTYSCAICDNKIEDLAILTGDKAYCASCFKCRNCKRKIENLRYARTSQGIFCMSCHEALMERRRKKSKAEKAKIKEEQQLRIEALGQVEEQEMETDDEAAGTIGPPNSPKMGPLTGVSDETTVSKDETSEPTLISSTSVVDTVAVSREDGSIT